MRSLVSGLLAALLAASGVLACSSEETSSGAGAGGAGGSSTTSSGGAGATSSQGGAGASGGGQGGSGQGGSAGSTGCHLTSPTGVQALTIDVGGTERTFVLSVPDGYDPATPSPLVFAWHGLGGSGSGARSYFGLEQQAAGAAIFVYPDGLVVEQGDTGWVLTVDGRDVAFYDALRAQLEAQYCVDTTRVFSTGHSFGGYMSNALGCARASELRAIAPVAGGGPWGACDTTPLSALVIHGSNDPTVDPSEGQGSLTWWRQQAGCSGESVATTPAGCVDYQGCTGVRVGFCTHEEGHSWPALAPEAVWGFFTAAP